MHYFRAEGGVLTLKSEESLHNNYTYWSEKILAKLTQNEKEAQFWLNVTPLCGGYLLQKRVFEDYLFSVLITSLCKRANLVVYVSKQ